MNRLGIFVFYDRDGIVDTYVEYLLATLKKHLGKLAVVCNGNLSCEGMERLERYADCIYTRENTGYDAMAYKLAMTEYIGWEEMRQYDEILLLNDTFYGPLYPWAEVFERMDKKSCDFWGITCQRECEDYYSGEKVSSYIQSYFMAFRKEMFADRAFQKYWNEFDSTDWIFSDVLNKHEKIFTRRMEQAGFSWDTYVHAGEYESDRPEDNFIQYYYISYQLIKDYRCPVIKKKNFVTKRLIGNPGEIGNDTAKSLAWIMKNTEYDVDMIWQNLLRLYDMGELRKTLNLSYVIPESPSEDMRKMTGDAEATAYVWMNGAASGQQEFYIQTLREYMEVCDGREAAETDCREYVLFLLGGEEQEAGTMLRKFSATEEQWGNLAGNRSHTDHIIDLFLQHRRLGVLLAPCGIHGADFGRGDAWRLNGCMALWCRRKIFQSMQRRLNEREATRFPAAEELRMDFMKTAQRLGYYTADGMRAEYASMAYNNMTEMLFQIEEHTKRRFLFDDFGSYMEGDMLLFCKGYPEIYVYGAGENGCRAGRLIEAGGHKFAGFIISDDQPEMTEKYGFPVFRLSKVERESVQAGIVISVSSRKAQAEILGQLHQQGWEHIYLL